MAKIVFDGERCVGCGLCASLCPDYFSMQGVSAVLSSPEVGSRDMDMVREVVVGCPVASISID